MLTRVKDDSWRSQAITLRSESPSLRRASLAVVLIGAFGLHLWAAYTRSQTLLEHDESISLLAAAGKSQEMGELEASSKSIAVVPAHEIKQWLTPSGTTVSDVRYSLAAHDRHPPLYFLILHAIERLGIESRTWLRLVGSLAIFLAAWFAARYIWPDASIGLQCLALAWLLASPVSLWIATELRQYGIVYLGIVISVAAIIRHWQAATGSRETIFLLVAAPAVLLWSQVASIIWVGVCLLLLIVPCFLKTSGAVRRFVWSLTISCVVLLPLGIRWLAYPTGLLLSAPVPPSQLSDRLLEPLFRSISAAWFTHPGRFEFTLVPSILGALSFVTVGAIGLTSRSVVHRRLTAAVLGWLVIWCLLIVAGRLPPQALMPKQLLAVIVCMFAILVREAQAGWKDRTGRIAIVFLLLSLATHPLGIIQLIHAKTSQAVLAADLSRADALLATAPQRGQFLPLIDALMPDATVIVGSSARLIQDWKKVEPALPADGLILAHIRSGNSGEALAELQSRLSEEYAEAVTLRDEKSRTLTAYRKRRSAITKP